MQQVLLRRRAGVRSGASCTSMKHVLLCLLLAAGCETKAAEPVPGFVSFSDLDRASAANVTLALQQLPIERDDLPRLEYLPRTLGEATRAIEISLDLRIPPVAEACDTIDWVLFAPAREADADGFESGWALRRSTLELYSFGTRR